MEDLLFSVKEGRRRLSDDVKHQLSKLIVDGTLKPGDELPSESELARLFNVSKPVVREALTELAAMRVVEIRQGRPSSVRSIDEEPLAQFMRFAASASEGGFADILELRCAIECYAAMLAATRISAQEKAQLSSILDVMRRNKENHEAWIDANIEFHEAIMRASGNTMFTFIFLALRELIKEGARMLHSRTDLRDPEQTFKRHADIVAAIGGGEAAAAFAAMQRHFDATVPVARQIVATATPA